MEQESPLGDWAAIAQMDFMFSLQNDIEKQTEENKAKRVEALKYCTHIFNNMNIDFEPDDSYRQNVRYMIIGLVLALIIKQKTVNLFKAGKEDRDVLASWAMWKIQSNLITRKVPLDEWVIVINDIYQHYKDGIKFDVLKDLVNMKPEPNKILNEQQLKASYENNKKEYKKRKGRDPYPSITI